MWINAALPELESLFGTGPDRLYQFVAVHRPACQLMKNQKLWHAVEE